MAFDPTQLGYTPVSTSGASFDPTKLGYSAVSPAPQAPQPSPLDGWGMLDQKINGVTPPPNSYLNSRPDVGGFLSRAAENISQFTGGNTIAKGLGQAIGNQQNSLIETQNRNSDIQGQLVQHIKDLKAKGADTTKSQQALDQLTQSLQDNVAQIGEAGNPNHITGEQLAGDALQLGTTIAGFGTYGKAATGLATGVLGKASTAVPTAVAGLTMKQGIKQGIIQGAKTGAIAGGIYGTSSGVSSAMKNDQSARDVALGGVGGGVTGAVGGGLLGGAIGGVAGGIGSYQTRKALLTAQEDAGMRTPLTQTVQNKPQLAPVIKEAQNQGISEKDINFLATASPEDKPTMQKMLNLAEQAQTDNRVIQRPLDVVGQNGTQLLKTVQKANSSSGALVDQTAKQLKGQIVDATGMHNKAMDLLSNIGVTANADGTPNWANSQFKKAPNLQNLIMNTLSDMPNGPTDALDMHNFKKSIDEVVNYGTNGEGLIGKSSSVLKQIRNMADNTLDTNFPAYNQANTDYKATRDLLDSAKQVIGKKVDFSSANGSQAFGQALRSSFSNNKSRGTVLQFISDLQNTANKYGANSKQNLLDQALFSQILEDNFGSPAVTGLSGEVGKAINNAKTVAGAVRHPIQSALETGASLIEKAQKVNPENKIRMLKALLK